MIASALALSACLPPAPAPTCCVSLHHHRSKPLSPTLPTHPTPRPALLARPAPPQCAHPLRGATRCPRYIREQAAGGRRGWVGG
jgi:hypothetical protein